MDLNLDSRTKLVSPDPGDTEAFLALLAEDRKRFDRWLRWPNSLATSEDVARFIAEFQAKEQNRDGFHAGIRVDGALAGGVENTRSRAVAERVGLTMDGSRRESHWITDRFVDHAVYGMLSRERAG